MSLITSRSNAKIKQARALRQRKIRQEMGLSLVEGIRHVGEALEAGADIESIIYAPDLLQSEFAKKLIDEQQHQGLACYATTDDVFSSIADKENPQGILAIVRQPKHRLDQFNGKNLSWGVALVEPQDPGNLGTIIRTVDAVGASGILLLDSCVDPFHPSAVRASMGAIFWHPIVSASFIDFVEWARRGGYSIYGTSAHASLDHRQVSHYQRPCILLMGSEREGLSDEQAATCDTLVRIPMRGRASSLNLAVAAGVLLYQMMESDA